MHVFKILFFVSVVFWGHFSLSSPVTSYAIEENMAEIDRDQSELLQMILEEKKKLKKIEAEKIRKIESDRLLQAKKDREHELAMEQSLAIETERKKELQRQELDKLQKEQQNMLTLQKHELVVERQLMMEIERRKELQKQELDKLRKEQNRAQQQRITRAKQHKIGQLTTHINLSQQSMMVYAGDSLLYKWSVSTAKKGHVTPVGTYRPQYLKKMHYSRRYHKSPMSHSIFYSGNFAIHGTNRVSHLGKRVSHGCVRLHPENARKLYSLVQKYGKKNTVIKISR